MGRRSLFGAIVALGLVLGAGTLAYQSTHVLVAAQWWVAHTHDVLDSVDAAVARLKDNDIVVRGLLVTGEDSPTRRHELDHPSVTRHLDRLRDLTADNPEQRDNVQAFDATIRAKLAYTDDLVRRHRARPLGAAELHGRLTEGLRRMDEIVGTPPASSGTSIASWRSARKRPTRACAARSPRSSPVRSSASRS